MAKLTEKVSELAEIAKSLPENLQVICFELLLRNYLEGRKLPPLENKLPPTEGPATPPPGSLDDVSTTPPADIGIKQEDLTNSDLHVKVKRFLERHALSVRELNNLFFKEDDQFKPLYEDLKTTIMSQSQIRVTLLLSLQRALTSGEFETDVEVVRAECKQRKCFDGGNFSSNYNN
ncbi:MAG: hypothetical protein ACREP6_04570, partial [Candidatus Binataceae bacterium]